MAAGALILAAGFSTRFGSDKRLHLLPDGRPMISATVRTYQNVFTHVAVVVRDSDSDLARRLADTSSHRLPIVVPTARAAQGMAASLADGIRAIADWDYAFIALADMPNIRTETLRQLDAEMRSARRDARTAIVQPTFEGKTGHPVGFSRELFADLIALHGDRGARSVIEANRHVLTEVVVDDRGVLEDFDQPPG